MSKAQIFRYDDIESLAEHIRNDLINYYFVVLYAHNGTGKTRVSMAFKDIGRDKENDSRDTLYFNAFTEDLFTWNNDLKDDVERFMILNAESNFFSGFQNLEMDTRIRPFLQRYVDFDFNIDYDKLEVRFSRTYRTNVEEDGVLIEKTEVVNDIKISRGEERIFIWCVYMAICELVFDDNKAYDWVKYLYIDDPISSLDDNNAIAVATDLSQLIQRQPKKIRTVISTHHALFFNVLFNELKHNNSYRYFLYKPANGQYSLRKTNDSPYFHHVASLNELKHAMDSDDVKTYHFNILRTILEKTASFFGYDGFGTCIHGVDDDVLFERALNLLSHGKYSVYEPIDMNEDNKDLFKRILNAFLDKYKFELPAVFADKATV